MSITRRFSSSEYGGSRVPRSARAHREIGSPRVRDENIRRALVNGRRSGSKDSFSLHGEATKAILVAVS